MHHRYYTSPIRPWQQERKPGSSRDESFKCNMRLFRNRKRWATNVVEIPIHSNLKRHVSFSLHFHCWMFEGAVSSMAMTTLNFTWLSWGGWLKVGEEASRWGSKRNFEKHETQDFNGTEKESKLQEKTGAWPQHQANNLAVDINQCWPLFTIELYDQFLSFLWTSLSFHRLGMLALLDHGPLYYYKRIPKAQRTVLEGWFFRRDYFSLLKWMNKMESLYQHCTLFFFPLLALFLCTTNKSYRQCNGVFTVLNNCCSGTGCTDWDQVSTIVRAAETTTWTCKHTQ